METYRFYDSIRYFGKLVNARNLYKREANGMSAIEVARTIARDFARELDYYGKAEAGIDVFSADAAVLAMCALANVVISDTAFDRIAKTI